MASLGDRAGLVHVETKAIGGQRVIIADPAVVRLFSLIERLAQADFPVLITGETGCGKELAAAAMHARSRRAHQPLIWLNCAGLPEALFDHALFGPESQVGSDDLAVTPGLLDAAAGSTLVLDEISGLALATQAKLLRALGARRRRQDSGAGERGPDVRIVATTNRDLEADVAAGRFHRDLYFRLSVATLEVPPLRQRLSELPLLAAAFLDEACRHTGHAAMRISDGAVAVLRAYTWPGNIRELKNVMQYAAAAVTSDVLLAAHVSELVGRLRTAWTPALRSTPAVPATGLQFRPIADELRELEITRIREALEITAGNQTRAAGLLAMPIRTFFAKAKQYGLTPGRKRYGADATASR